MFKVTPLFPLSTKDKQTSTSVDFKKSPFAPTHSAWTLQSSNQKPLVDLHRLGKLAQPKINKQKQTCFNQTSPHFFRTYRKQIPNESLSPISQTQHFSKNYPSKTEPIFKQKPNWTEDSLFSKNSFRKWGENNLKTQKSKEKDLATKSQQKHFMPVLTLRKINTEKCKTLLNDSMFRNPKIEKKPRVFDPRMLKSSDLASIYSSLYNKYEVVPFNEQEEQEQVLVELVENNENQKEKVESTKVIKKERKSFGIKKLEFERNLRKEIKCLTRDTDHILSLEFRDIREVNIR